VSGLKAPHLRVGVRLPAVPPRNVPVGVAHLAADEQGRVQQEAVSARGLEHVIEHPEVILVVAPGLRLDRRPEEVDPDGVETDRGHGSERVIERLGTDAPRPVRALDGHDVRPDRQKGTAASAKEMPSGPDDIARARLQR
jgi:hypothetical protein